MAHVCVVISYSWITGFARRRRHISSTCFRAAFASLPARSISKSFELWTAWTPSNPRSFRALWTLSPSGSVTPSRRRTSTRTRTISLLGLRMASAFLGLSRRGGDMEAEEGEPVGRPDERSAGPHLGLQQSLCDQGANRGERRAAGHAPQACRGDESLGGNRSSNETDHRPLGGREHLG